MDTLSILFLVCAAVGSTVLVCQFLLMLIGLGGDDFDLDDGGGVGADFHGDFGASSGGDMSADVHGGLDGGGGDVHGGHDGADGHAHGHGHSQGLTQLLAIISFRTVVAALAFFGIGGMAAKSAGAAPAVTVAIACIAGFSAMYAVYWVMRSLYGLQAEGTARIRGAVGLTGKVYLRIPGHNAGTGKIHVNLQNRTMEYTAITSGEGIPTGASVVVVDIVAPDTVEVEPVLAPERIEENV